MPREALKTTAKRMSVKPVSKLALQWQRCGRYDGIHPASPAAIIFVTRPHQRDPRQPVG